MAVNAVLGVAIWLPALTYGLRFTIGDYKVTEEGARTLNRLAINSRMDHNSDPMYKYTTVFTKWYTESQLFKQCTNDDNTVYGFLRYYVNYYDPKNPTTSKKYSMTRYVPSTKESDPDYAKAYDSTDFGHCSENAAKGNYSSMMTYYGYNNGFLGIGSYKYFGCKVSKTHYDIADGQKCDDSGKFGVYIVHDEPPGPIL